MPAPKTDSMRGLAVFISDMRNCKSREEEDRRVNKELANIRSKFKGDKTLDGYQKKKYVCKLLFIFLLGHEIDFGYNEAVNLLSSNKYTEKQMGYLFISVLLNENHSLMNLVVLNLKNDLNSKTSIFVNLALQCIANIGTREMVEHFAKEMPKLLLSGEVIDSTKQNAALCLLRFIRIAPDLVSYEEWPNRVVHLLNDPHLGVVTSAVSLIEILVQRSPEDYSSCFSFAISRLSRLVTSASSDFQDYSYYFITAPWLCVKLLRLLQNFNIPQDTALSAKLNECLEAILKKVNDPPKSKKIQHPNAKNSILFEAINLIIYMDSDQKMLVRASNQLGLFLQNKETNLRYLALESLCLLATSEYSHDAVKKHQETVITALKAEKDVSVRQKAVDLLYAMCDRSNAQTIVSEMLTYLETADFSIREEMVLKVAILSEKYATDYSWYVDTILNLIRVAGDYVSEEVWHRVIQIVVNREELQAYVAKTVFESLKASACHENMIKVGGYILGEFGNLIARDSASPPQKQFEILHAKYHLCSPLTRQLLLTTFIKFINLFPEMKEEIQETLRNDLNSRSSNVEIQQRATEYLSLSNIGNIDTLAIVLEVMPPFPERESSILSKLKAKKPLMAGQLTNNGSPIKQAALTGASPVKAITANGENEKPMLALPSGNSEQRDLVDFDSTSCNSVPAITDIPKTNGHQNIFMSSLDPSPILNRKQYDEFLMKKNGVLFENEYLQVGIKSEFRTWQGRLLLFYGNKSGSSLVNITHEINSDMCGSSLIIQSQAIPNILVPGSQVQQMIGIDCMSEFNIIPTIVIKFSLNALQHEICLYLPVSLNKFLTPAVMPKDSFTQRWSNLKLPDQESQKIVDAKGSMDKEEVKGKLECFGLATLSDIDTNPNNFVVAGIVHVSQMQFGILGRIEPNSEVRKYRITLRSVKGSVGQEIIRILEMII